jgi:hypothetical protein
MLALSILNGHFACLAFWNLIRLQAQEHWYAILSGLIPSVRFKQNVMNRQSLVSTKSTNLDTSGVYAKSNDGTP